MKIYVIKSKYLDLIPVNYTNNNLLQLIKSKRLLPEHYDSYSIHEFISKFNSDELPVITALCCSEVQPYPKHVYEVVIQYDNSKEFTVLFSEKLDQEQDFDIHEYNFPKSEIGFFKGKDTIETGLPYEIIRLP